MTSDADVATDWPLEDATVGCSWSAAHTFPLSKGCAPQRSDLSAAYPRAQCARGLICASDPDWCLRACRPECRL